MCDASVDHALRAGQLLDPLTRRELARSLREVVRRAENPSPAPFGSTVPVLGNVVLSWREGLLGLAERLERPVPTNPCGVARVLLLLTDGAGPLYSRAPQRPIGEMLWWIADGLQLGQRPV